MESVPSQIIHAGIPFSFFASGIIFLFTQPQCVKISRKTQIQKSIRCAQKKRGQWKKSVRSGKQTLQLAYQIASKLKIVPEPLDIMLKEFGAAGGGSGSGSGSGSRFWKGSGWGGFDGWGKRRRRKRGQMEWLGILVILTLGLWFVSGKEGNAGACWGSLGLVLFGLSINGLGSGLKDWALGFSCAVLVGLVFRKEECKRLMKSSEAMKKLMVKKWKSRRVF